MYRSEHGTGRSESKRMLLAVALFLTGAGCSADPVSAGMDMLDQGLVPAVILVSPSSGPPSGGTQMTILGSGFQLGSALSVRVDGKEATGVTWVSDTRLEAILPAKDGGFGAVNVVVINPNGQRSNPFPFYYSGSLGMLSMAGYDVGESPASAVAADLDGDGLTDLVAADQVNAEVNVVLGSSDRQLVWYGRYFVGNSPLGLVAGDFNRDKRFDVAVATQRQIVILMAGTTPGTLNVQARYDLPARYVATGDLDGDGTLDLVTDGIVVLLGNGDGTFRTVPNASANLVRGGARAWSIADMNRDNRSDIVATAPDHLALLLGRGDGTFAAEMEYPLQGTSTQLVVGDWNGDQRPDVAVGSQQGPIKSGNPGVLSVLFSNANGMLSQPNLVALSLSPETLIAADWNHDGLLDLAVGSEDASAVQILSGSKDGSFVSASTLSAPGPVRCLVSGDFDGDSKLDLATIGNNFSGPGAFFAFGIGNLSYRAMPRYDVGFLPSALIVGEFNGDARPDLVAADGAGPPYSALYVLSSTLDGALAPVAVSVPSITLGALAAGDFNGDGRTDVASLSAKGDVVSVFAGDGKGPLAHFRDIDVAAKPGMIGAGDLDGDGYTDLVFAGAPDPRIILLWSDGAGGFVGTVGPLVGPTASALVVADLNSDGRLDVIVADHDSGGVAILLAGDGRKFAAASIVTAVPGVNSLAVVNLDGDRRMDLVVGGGKKPGTLRPLLGDGKGAFRALDPIPLPGIAPTAVAGADFNGDGVMDVVINATFLESDILLGRGDGTFLPPMPFVTGGLGRGVAIGDWNVDGRPDVAVLVAGAARGSVSLLLNDSR